MIDSIHAIFAFLAIFYGFIIGKNWFDIYYLYINVLVAIHWTLLKGECIISLVDKWKKDPDYKMGSTVDISDIINIFGEKNAKYMWFVCKVMYYIKIVAIYIVLQRNNIKHSEWICFVFFIYFLLNINSYLYHCIFFVLFTFILFNLKK